MLDKDDILEALFDTVGCDDTAPERLRSIAGLVVEVFCDCPVEVSAARFVARERHPGHLDRLRTADEHEEGIRRLRESYRGPLGVSDQLVTVDTSRPVDIDALLDTVRSAMPREPEPAHPTS